jgi:ABC-type antimicrobial peptide transport system permease subunit
LVNFINQHDWNSLKSVVVVASILAIVLEIASAIPDLKASRR